MSNADEIKRLLSKLEQMQQRQEEFLREIHDVKAALLRIRGEETPGTVDVVPDFVEGVPGTVEGVPDSVDTGPGSVDAGSDSVGAAMSVESMAWGSHVSSGSGIGSVGTGTGSVQRKPGKKSDWEKFIGENLINKIGIAITVIGVAIGTKYVVDRDLISPLTRIILGYLFGGGLLAIAFRLKEKYENFSAVLLSGAMAILYFVSYAAYSFYELIPQALAFLLMFLFTVFTVIAALKYDRVVIAHIGMVGAYGVPFLLSDGSGKVGVLFSYMAIINAGILAIAVKKYWRSLYYMSFILTWLIFSTWFAFSYSNSRHFWMALGFATVFFLIFYLVFLAYKFLRGEKFLRRDVVLLLANSFIYYGIGYAILDNNRQGSDWLGLFTVFNGLIHFIVTAFIYRRKLADKNLFYLVAGLVLIFITIAIPVQLDGKWVTMLWSGEAALLFWIGRTRQVKMYEGFSFPLMVLAFLSLMEDWMHGGSLLANIFFVLAFGFIVWIDRRKEYPSNWSPQKSVPVFVSYAVGAVLVFAIYSLFRIEIEEYWNNLFLKSELSVRSKDDEFPQTIWNTDLFKFRQIWGLNYSMLFLAVLSFVNLKWIKSRGLAWANIVLNLFFVLLFLTQGLLAISLIRESYLSQSLAEYYKQGSMHIMIRYISFVFLALLVYATNRYSRESLINYNLSIPYGLFLHTVILWCASSELIHLLDMASVEQTYKLGLSILWGSYSLLLISIGIWKKKKYLRIAAIALFGVTLVKLFLYDISALSSIAKTVVFVALGILLLVISFLYNKYKHLIADEVKS